MSNRDELVLKKIVQYADEINETIVRFDITRETLDDDFVVRNAISMCILQIGELVAKLSDGFKTTNNLMPWRDIKAMRNIAAHNYGEMDYDMLWETAIYDIPDLREYCIGFITE